MADNKTGYGLQGSERGNLTKAIQSLTGASVGTRFSDEDIVNFLKSSYDNYSQEELIEKGITDKTYKSYGLSNYEEKVIEKFNRRLKEEQEKREKLKKETTWKLDKDKGVPTKADIDAMAKRASTTALYGITPTNKFDDIYNNNNVDFYSKQGKLPKWTTQVTTPDSKNIDRLKYKTQDNIPNKGRHWGIMNYLDATDPDNTEKLPKAGGGSNIETKGKVGKYGRSALGLGVMFVAGSAITSLMMGSNKGRLNNSQMYGQQPYTQY